MLVEDAESTHGYIEQTLEKIAKQDHSDDVQTEAGEVDEFVQSEVPYTSGQMYFAVQNRLTRYPIPEIRLPASDGDQLLDIGCNWGRWSIAAAQKGYRPVGLDPSLNAVLAARRVSKQLGVETDFVVGDSRFLPFADSAFDVVFSYGVFQHLSKANARISLDEAARVLKPGHKGLFQMPNKYGIRSVQNRWRRGWAEGEGFDVRFWSPGELTQTFEQKFGPSVMSTDCFFGLGIQANDADLMPARFRAVIRTSEFLRRLSTTIKPLTNVADSVYLEVINKK
jgi:ubiquinone/menaquinone biosynthesis C-methylase UbiE